MWLHRGKISKQLIEALVENKFSTKLSQEIKLEWEERGRQGYIILFTLYFVASKQFSSTLPALCISESCIKITLILIFKLLCGSKDFIKTLNIKYACRIFLKPNISNKKRNISNKKPSIQMETLDFWHIEFEIQGILSKIPSISKKV